MLERVNAPVQIRGSPLIVNVSPLNSTRSPALTSVPSGTYAVHASFIPKTRPSCDRLVVAGCTEQPLTVVFVTLFSDQSGIVEPLDVVVEGRTITIVCFANDGNISENPRDLVRI